MKIGIIMQARSQSRRFPRKIYAPFNNGKHSIQCILEGMKKTNIPHKIILAMPYEDKEEIENRIKSGELENYIDDRFDLFIGNGDQSDLVDRYHKAMRKFSLDVCVRLTCDCPMHIATANIIDEMLFEYMTLKTNGFMGNNLLVAKAPAPCGIDVEIFSYDLMCWAKMYAKTPHELEHCVPIMYGPFSQFEIHGFENIRPHFMVSRRIADFSLDTLGDYELLKILMDNYDKYQDLNKAIENADIGGFDKTSDSKNFRQ